jgi:hypothetical protein
MLKYIKINLKYCNYQKSDCAACTELPKTSSSGFCCESTPFHLKHDEVSPDATHGPQRSHIVLIAGLILHKHGVQSVAVC